ncbi:response regulator [Candidatus Microgenomates bacterium]|nr:response regulator [Candidatus Microgenomates bacterium]
MAGSKTILFIEDDPFVVDMYQHVLTKAGYTVDTAFDGNEGLTKAQANKYDLLLVDIMIPEMTGIEVLEKLRAGNSQKLANTKVVILTNLAQDEESRRALEAQADGYLIKADITPSRLVELVGQVLSA